ncbi:MAG: hypothetical protein Q9183_002914 [Haloplaca sp. 2 TL-2023]
MSAPTQVNDLQSLLTKAANTRVDCRAICGSKANIIYSATNLYGILRRLHQEASMARSSLLKPSFADEEQENLTAFCLESHKLLSDTSDFLHAYQTICDHEDRILGSREFGSFTDRQNLILDHFDAEIMRLTNMASRILIAASAETLGELREQLDHGTESPLSPVLNDLTARLMANGDLRLSMLVKGAGNEQILWDALEGELLDLSLDEEFLRNHKKVILRYVRALERRSGFSCSPAVDGSSTSQKPQNKSTKRQSLGSDDDPHGSKRARVSADLPRIPSKYGPEVDDDLLADFEKELDSEDPDSNPRTPRQRMRDIYRTLRHEYQPRYEGTLFISSRGHNSHDQKNIVGLIYGIEKKVVMELDNLELRRDAEVRGLRKMIIIKAQKMLDDLEKIKVK